MAAPVTLSAEFEDKLRALIAANSTSVRNLYYKSISDISIYAKSINQFNLDASPALKTKMDKVLQQMAQGVETHLTTSIQQAWGLANDKNNNLNDSVSSRAIAPAVYSSNADALVQYVKRQDNGLGLSDRVWKNVEPYKHELEAGLTATIGTGQSAAKAASLLKANLQQPDRIFRRVNGKLSKAAQRYHPKTGVYRSSYQNSLRLTGTEINMAYRNSDHERWNKEGFVTGIEIVTSNNHPHFDECDALAGIYPKDFLFEGWHPRCRCHAIPILATPDQLDAMEDKFLGLSGDDPDIEYVNKIPAGAAAWIKANWSRIQGWSNQPYWMTHNPTYMQAATAVGTVVLPPLPRILSYEIKQISEYQWHVLSEGQKVGEFTIESQTVVGAELDEAFRGQGIYTKFLLDYVRKNKILYSWGRSPSAERVWQAILKDLPDDMVVTQTKEEGEFQIVLKLKEPAVPARPAAFTFNSSLAVMSLGKKVGQFVVVNKILLGADIDAAFMGRGVYQKFLKTYVKKNGQIQSRIRNADSELEWQALIKKPPKGMEVISERSASGDTWLTLRNKTEAPKISTTTKAVRFDFFHGTYVSASDMATINRYFKQAIGREITENEFVNLVGGMPEAGTVITSLKVRASDSVIMVEIDTDKYTATRTINMANMSIHNDYFRVQAAHTGGGLGTKVLFNEVQQASLLGFKLIETQAARGTRYNGYYTWARLGYKISKVNLSDFTTLMDGGKGISVPKSLRNVKTLAELMSTKEGSDFWKNNGFTFEGEFDLSAGSDSRIAIEAQVEAKFPLPKPAPVLSFDNFYGTYIPVAAMKQISGMFLKYFGKGISERELINLAGGLVEPNAVVSKISYKIVSPTEITVQVRTNHYYTYRTIHLDTKSIHNDLFEVNENQQGNGLGTKVLYNQVEQAAAFGFKTIDTSAARLEGTYNGYYTWARMGYKMQDFWANTFKSFMKNAPPKFNKIKTLAELMSTKAGSDFWKEQGFAFEGVFDLAKGSDSRTTLTQQALAKVTAKVIVNPMPAWMAAILKDPKYKEYLKYAAERVAAFQANPASFTKLNLYGIKQYNLTPEEAALIYAFTSTAYGKLNRDIYTGASNESSIAYQAALTAAIKKLPTYSGEVIRYFKTEDANALLAGYKKNLHSDLEFKGFLSTSYDMDVEMEGDIIFHIQDTTTGRIVESVSESGYEKEVLFMPNSRFEILKVDGNEVYLRQIT